MTLCLLLSLLAGPARANPVEYLKLKQAVAAVKAKGGERYERRFRERLAQAEKSAARYQGCAVAGKIALEGPGDPEAVSSQMRIFPGGYFVDAYDPKGRPLGFRAPGYDALDVTPTCDDGLAWLDLTLKPTPAGQRGAFQARLSPAKPDGLEVSVYPSMAPPNRDGAGVDAREACRGRCPEIPASKVVVGDDGALSAQGLSPLEHGLSISAPGYVWVYSTFSVVSGQTADLGLVELEKAKVLKLRSLATEKLPFSGAVRESTTTAAEAWSSIPKGSKQWWHEIVFSQKNGEITLSAALGPADLADLGAGTVEDFAKKASEKSFAGRPWRLPVVDGHVYLLRERYWGRWVLFSVAVIPRP